MEKVRLGIIGIGNMGTGHLCNIEMHKRCPEITVTAVADIKPSGSSGSRTTSKPPLPFLTMRKR